VENVHGFDCADCGNLGLFNCLVFTSRPEPSPRLPCLCLNEKGNAISVIDTERSETIATISEGQPTSGHRSLPTAN